jgi:hypothetical protein
MKDENVMPPSVSDVEAAWMRMQNTAANTATIFIQGVGWGILIFQTLHLFNLSSRLTYGIIYGLLAISLFISHRSLKRSQRYAQATWVQFRAWAWDQMKITLPVKMPTEPQGWEAISLAIKEWKGPSEETRQD